MPLSTLTFLEECLDSPIGRVLVLTDEADVVRAIDFQDYRARMERLLSVHYRTQGWTIRSRAGTSEAACQLDAYFSGDIEAINELRVSTSGTAFQADVWASLRQVRPGMTTSYGALAAAIGRPDAVRAVGQANGSNPVAIVVPCHRVIGRSGALTGYGGGIERKRWLLSHELRNVSTETDRFQASA